MGVTVSINGADQRTDQALAKVTRDNQIVTLTASRDLRFLLQEVLEKQMTARGYMVGPNGPVICKSSLANCMLMCPRATCAITSRPKRISPSCYRAEWQQNDQETIVPATTLKVRSRPSQQKYRRCG